MNDAYHGTETTIERQRFSMQDSGRYLRPADPIWDPNESTFDPSGDVAMTRTALAETSCHGWLEAGVGSKP